MLSVPPHHPPGRSVAKLPSCGPRRTKPSFPKVSRVPRPDAAAAAHTVDRHASLGWREWAALPGLGITAIKAKLDSGARTSSLHVEAIEAFDLAGVAHVRFQVRVRRRGNAIVA